MKFRKAPSSFSRGRKPKPLEGGLNRKARVRFLSAKGQKYQSTKSTKFNTHYLAGLIKNFSTLPIIFPHTATVQETLAQHSKKVKSVRQALLKSGFKGPVHSFAPLFQRQIDECLRRSEKPRDINSKQSAPALALGLMGSRESIPLLEKMLERTDDTNLQMDVIHSLALLNSRNSCLLLERLLRRKGNLEFDRGGRIAAMDFLAHYSQTKSLPIIESQLNNNDNAVKAAALATMARLHSPRIEQAISHLQKELDTQPGVAATMLLQDAIISARQIAKRNK